MKKETWRLTMLSFFLSLWFLRWHNILILFNDKPGIVKDNFLYRVIINMSLFKSLSHIKNWCYSLNLWNIEAMWKHGYISWKQLERILSTFYSPKPAPKPVKLRAKKPIPAPRNKSPHQKNLHQLQDLRSQ